VKFYGAIGICRLRILRITIFTISRSVENYFPRRARWAGQSFYIIRDGVQDDSKREALWMKRRLAFGAGKTHLRG
jgi:hypothetical protein